MVSFSWNETFKSEWKAWLTGNFNADGLERMLRMVQAILMVILSQPFLTSGFVKLVAYGNEHVWDEPRVASTAALTDLRVKVALVRRFFRVFRFLESFRAAHMIYTSFYAPVPALPEAPVKEANVKPPETAAQSLGSGAEKEGDKKDLDTQRAEPSPSAPAPNQAHRHGPNCRHHQAQPKLTSTGPPAEAWLDMLGRTFNGMYLLLEALTLIDVMQLPGLPLWGAQWTSVLNVEGQRFWFLALACGIVSGLLKLVKLVAHGPVPQTGEGYGTGETGQVSTHDGSGADGEANVMPEWQRQREKMRRIVYARKEARKAWKREIGTRGYGLARRCVADLFDLPVPGSVVGWVRVEPVTVGLVMVVSTWLTGLEVWERCGREIKKTV